MRKYAWLSLLLLIALAFGSAIVPGQAPKTNFVALPSFTEPTVSPDRSEIAFVSGGDIWTVPAAGGEARLLVSHPANESRPLYSPDGKKLKCEKVQDLNSSGSSSIYSDQRMKMITMPGVVAVVAAGLLDPGLPACNKRRRHTVHVAMAVLALLTGVGHLSP